MACNPCQEAAKLAAQAAHGIVGNTKIILGIGLSNADTSHERINRCTGSSKLPRCPHLTTGGKCDKCGCPVNKKVQVESETCEYWSMPLEQLKDLRAKH